MVKSGTIRLASDLSNTPVRKSWFKESTHPTVQYSIHIYPVLLSVPAVSYGMLNKIKNNDNFVIPGLADRLYRASYSTLPATSPAGSGATYRVSSAQGTGTASHPTRKFPKFYQRRGFWILKSWVQLTLPPCETVWYFRTSRTWV